MHPFDPAGGNAPAGFFTPPPTRYTPAMTTAESTTPLIVVHDATEARAALAAAARQGVAVTLLSPPTTSAALGPGIFAECVDFARPGFEHVLAGALFDCGDAAGLAMAALRRGGLDVLIDSPDDPLAETLAETQAKIADLAGQLGRRALSRRDPGFAARPVLDLANSDNTGGDVETRVTAFLQAHMEPAKETLVP